MAKSRKHQRLQVARPAGRAAVLEGTVRWSAALKQWVTAWYRAKNPVLLFVLVFGFLLALFYALTVTPLFRKTFFPGYLRFNAQAGSSILNLLGQQSSTSGFSISSARFTVDIRRGCDAVEPTALFVAAVLAFPAAFRRKIPGVVAGTGLLVLLNLVRILSLFLVGVYFPKAFEWMHGDVWQALFILLSVLLWALWAQWALKLRPPGATPHVPA